MKFVLPDKLLKCVLFGTLAISPAAYALSCRYVVPELDSRPVLAANLRFNVAARSVWMWREVLDSEIGRCTLRDFPEPAALSEAQTKQMRKAWRAQNREEFFSSELASEPVIEGAILVAPEGAPPLSGLKPRNPPETNFNENKSQHAGELLGQNLSLIRREQAQALIPPTAFLNAAVRFSAHRCESAMGGRGSGVLMAPTIVLTAAHVVADEAGALCEAYRAVPGGDSYLAKEPSPLGVYISTKVWLSERGGWNVGKAPLPTRDATTQAQFEARTRHDWAIVALKSNVRGSHVWPLLRFSENPQTLADCQAQVLGQAIVKIGYPLRGLYGETRRGKAITNRGYGHCGVELPPLVRFSLFTNPGDSGAGMFVMAENNSAPLKLRSLAALSEMRNSFAIESLGPSFDLTDYQHMLGFLQNQP